MKKLFTNDDNDPVTKGFLRKEFKREFEVFENKIDQKFERVISTILTELQNMRAENRELYQVREQLYQNDIIQERRMDDLDERVLRLEIA